MKGLTRLDLPLRFFESRANGRHRKEGHYGKSITIDEEESEESETASYLSKHAKSTIQVPIGKRPNDANDSLSAEKPLSSSLSVCVCLLSH